MAKEKNLTAVTSVAAADFARVVTSAGASVKATFANVAKYIVETYNGSMVAGSAQSVKSALDSLNSNITWAALTNLPLSNCSEYLGMGVKYAVVGNICHVYINVSGLTANNRVKIATLPSGARPLVNTLLMGAGGTSYTAKAYFTINSTGEIYVLSDDTYASAYFNFIRA